MHDVQWARDLAERLLAEPLPRRWAHVQGVGHKAESIAHIVGDDADLLICAAWLHDIGYAPDVVDTGFHSLDGARYLRDIEHAEERLCGLVAHHSCACFEARNRGLGKELIDEFALDGTSARDALTYCDMTTAANGSPTSAHERLADINSRYGSGHIVARSISQATPSIIATISKIDRCLNE